AGGGPARAGRESDGGSTQDPSRTVLYPMREPGLWVSLSQPHRGARRFPRSTRRDPEPRLLILPASPRVRGTALPKLIAREIRASTEEAEGVRPRRDRSRSRA